jgi:hypothetical protein
MSDFTKILKVSPLGDGDNWILLEEFKYYDTRVIGSEAEPYWITVPPKLMTDFASVPPVFRSLVSNWGKHGNAAVLHDYLYWEQKLTKSHKKADDIFLDAMKVMEVKAWRRFIVYWSVRLGGAAAWRGNIKKRNRGWNRIAARWPEKAKDKPKDLQTKGETKRPTIKR